MELVSPVFFQNEKMDHQQTLDFFFLCLFSTDVTTRKSRIVERRGGRNAS